MVSSYSDIFTLYFDYFQKKLSNGFCALRTRNWDMATVRNLYGHNSQINIIIKNAVIDIFTGF